MILEHYKKLLHCGFFSAPKTPINPVEVTPDIELVEIITGGMVRHEIDGEERIFRKGAIFWHQHGEKTIYRTSPAEPYRCLFLHFGTDGSPRPFGRYANWADLPVLNNFVEDMLSFREESMLDQEAVFLYAIGTLLRQRIPVCKTKLPNPLQKACRLLSRDPTQDISIDEAAEKAGVSKSHLFTLFRKHLQSSPYHYLLGKRIELARELLTTRQDIPIKQIAESCGFNTLEIFYRRFRQYTGVSPAIFRAAAQTGTSEAAKKNGG